MIQRKNGKRSIALVLLVLTMMFFPMTSVLAEDGIPNDKSGASAIDVPANVWEPEGVYLELEEGDSVTFQNKVVTVLAIDPYTEEATIDIDGVSGSVLESKSIDIKGVTAEFLDIDGEVFAPTIDIWVYPIGEKPVKPSDSLVTLEMSPSEQAADIDGSAIYELTLKDNHDKDISSEEPATYRYRLSGMTAPKTGEEPELEFTFLDGDSFTLEAGELINTSVRVRSLNEQTNKVIITASTSDAEAIAYGVIAFSSSNPIETEIPLESVFQGTGFILSEDESDAFLIENLVITTSSSPTAIVDGVTYTAVPFPEGGFTNNGKLTLNTGQNFKIADLVLEETEVDAPEQDISFGILGIVGTSTGTDEVDEEMIANFSGTVRQFEGFKILRGTITGVGYSPFGARVWELNAVSGYAGITQSISIQENEEKIVETTTKDVLALPSDSKGELYVKPVRIKERKILGIIPTGKNQLEVEIVKGSKSFKKNIRENAKVEIEGYEISVGTLVDESKLEISLRKAA